MFLRDHITINRLVCDKDVSSTRKHYLHCLKHAIPEFETLVFEEMFSDRRQNLQVKIEFRGN